MFPPDQDGKDGFEPIDLPPGGDFGAGFSSFDFLNEAGNLKKKEPVEEGDTVGVGLHFHEKLRKG
ncbi:hypothetical protein COY93_03695 [Candidatus Uhrbacteria bacterium CG_4_10_14_0_8_um_filter_58_22]|uniref:Uncharacterized protein n=1 Tax=Candidatus Uhrbacteria bacterium CG_4_10_14_0_8_um_filter_58_22 TaxID=1975029 RepID=A0A2M7QA20_9BACT|nr:MAG: hypothetical protein AUJ19_00910 [Parcubacteria group bacterium CG1_02_58_44]PIY62151.1 MAG: hypothetical protein COY93_03695 [Candidatus Uhrbacteria bacterium CG_4_10_14_0_8_um_filter_58_22]